MGKFTRSVKDRCFAVFLSALLAFLSGSGLWIWFTADRAEESRDWVARLFLHGFIDIVGIAFVCGVLGVAWGVFLPAWIDRVIRFAVDHFVQALAVFLLIVLGMLVFSWLTL